MSWRPLIGILSLWLMEADWVMEWVPLGLGSDVHLGGRLPFWAMTLKKAKTTTAAFHVMLWLMDYCVKLAQRKFDMDNVIRICNLVFKKDGVVMESNFSHGDEMIGVLGRGKTTPGGEVRSQFTSLNSKLCVARVVGFLMEKIQHKKKTTPLFAWSDKSKWPGKSFRYCDIMNLVKDAAEACSRDTSKYGSLVNDLLYTWAPIARRCHGLR